MATNLSELTSLRIWFKEQEEEERGFYALLTSGMPVYASQDGKYVINQKQCEMLSKKGIHYEKEPPTIK